MSTLTVRRMTAEDRDWVMPRVRKFYTTGAVVHEVDEAVLQRTFEAAVSDNPRIDGFVLCGGAQDVGYAYLTYLYSSEAGECVMIEEVYIDENQRGNGYGQQFFDWLLRAYPDAARFRLEVTENNAGAARLYRRVGFVPLEYQQMILDR